MNYQKMATVAVLVTVWCLCVLVELSSAGVGSYFKDPRPEYGSAEWYRMRYDLTSTTPRTRTDHKQPDQLFFGKRFKHWLILDRNGAELFIWEWIIYFESPEFSYLLPIFTLILFSQVTVIESLPGKKIIDFNLQGPKLGVKIDKLSIYFFIDIYVICY